MSADVKLANAGTTGTLDVGTLVAGANGTTGPVAIAVNAAGEVLTGGTSATSIGKAEDAAHASGDVGAAILGVRNDSNTARSGTDGDYTPVSVTSAGAVHVSGPVAHNGVVGGTGPVRIGGVFSNNGAANDVAAGDVADILVDTAGRVGVFIGTYGGSNNATPTDSRATADTEAATIVGLVTNPRLQVYNGTTWDRVRSAQATNAAAIGALSVGGPTAHDAAAAGNPVRVGGYASAAVPAAFANADAVNAWYSTNGHAYASRRPIVDTNSAAASRANGATIAIGDLGRFDEVTVYIQVTVVGNASAGTVYLEVDPQGGGTYFNLGDVSIGGGGLTLGTWAIVSTVNRGLSDVPPVFVPGGTYRLRLVYTDGGTDPTIGFVVVGK